MSRPALRVVQFVHPGFEYHRQEHLGPRHTRSGAMRWKPGRTSHDRKFLLTWGSLLEPVTGQDHVSAPLAFWGEWEGPSVFWRVESPGRPLPAVIHSPFRPASYPRAPVQNTDPMVFGDGFIYSNCLQGAYRSLRTLTPGSIVLFGRFGRVAGQGSFSLDTCLVVDRVQALPPVPFDADSYGSDLLTDAVLSPLHTEGFEGALTVYSGLRRSPGVADPFSFFPAQLIDDSPPLFARPELRPIGALDGVISPNNMQGIKVTSNLSTTDRDAIWNEVVRQVWQWGCGLGYYASPPPVLDDHAVESSAMNAPMPLGHGRPR
jgi:hypothetical protein